MRLGSWCFTPSWFPTLVTLVLLPILAGLGFWQLDRGAQKSAQADAHAARAAAPPVPLTALPLDVEAVRYRSVMARGRYDGEQQIVHAYQPNAGRLGFNVYTPLELSAGGPPHTVLVHRGWVPHGPERLDVPPLPVPDTEVAVRGMLDRYPAVGLRLGPADDGHAGWPRVVQYMEQAHLEGALHRELRPYVLRLEEGQPGALTPNWTLFHFGPERHYGYALQWFGLTLALLVIYIAVNTRRCARAERKGG
ncbi:SURF1 family protein [Ectothiorhodospiraceae bacterium 2226]|nr:SURF1 family protein [Ectothiorhodospiraceae bacterium 2226]